MTPLKGESKTGIGYDVIVTQQCEVELSITAIESSYIEVICINIIIDYFPVIS